MQDGGDDKPDLVLAHYNHSGLIWVDFSGPTRSSTTSAARRRMDMMTGVHFFENLKIDRVSKAVREKELLLNTNWPFPGEGKYVRQENGPAPK